jgi:hypothetical protein
MNAFSSFPRAVDFIDEVCRSDRDRGHANNEPNISEPHLSSALATIQIPKASMPAEIKYAVSFSMFLATQ